jgi:hypothetical protein
LSKGLSLEQLGDEIRRAVMESEVVDGDEVGVVERASETRLLLKAAKQLWVSGESFVDDLEGNLTPQPGVACAVHLGHSTGTEDRQHLVRAQPRSRSQAHRRRLAERGTACRTGMP